MGRECERRTRRRQAGAAYHSGMGTKHFDTRLIHAGLPSPPLGGAVVTPVFQSAICHFEGEEDYHDIRYIRLNNTPNHLELHAKLAALEGADPVLNVRLQVMLAFREPDRDHLEVVVDHERGP